MKKKIIIGLSVFLVVLLTSAVTFAVNSGVMNKKHVPSDYKIGVTYDEALNANEEKPVLALFYVDWCVYCLRFMPKFKTVESLYKSKYSIVMLNAEDENNKKLVEDVSLTGFPTLYIIDPKYDNRVLLNNAIYMDLKKLRVELDRYLNIRSKLDDAATYKK